MDPNMKLRESFARGILAAHLKPGDLITENALERPLLLLRDLPDVDVTSELGPSKTQVGAADLTVKLTENRRLVSGYVDVDNHGNRFSGEYRFGINLNSGNFTGYQDMVTSGGVSYSADVNTGAGLLGLVGAILVGIIQGLGTNAALREVSGQKPTFASLFRVPNLGMIVLTALLLIAAYFVASLVCGIGLLVVLVFAVFTFHGVIDKNQNAWAAFIASFKLVGRNFGAVFLLELALLGINILGAIPCGLGWLITIPVSYLALAFAYRRLTGGPVMA
jgi:hypothetical protein